MPITSAFQEAPEHKVDFTLSSRKIRVFYHKLLLAESDESVLVKETGREPVFYLPRGAVDMSCLKKSDKTYDCPFKGHASYYSLNFNDQEIENVAWSYEWTFAEAEIIKDHIAFDPRKVQIMDLTAGA